MVDIPINGQGEWDFAIETNGVNELLTWYFRMVKDDGTPLSNYSKYPLATYIPYIPTYALTITSTNGGTTNPSPGTYYYYAGTVVTVTAIPDANYKLDHWELDGSPAGSQNQISVTMNTDHVLKAYFTYDVTITAHCNTEGVDISVPITMDGSPTGYNTPHTFTGLTGTHTFTVPNTDPSGHPFKQWSTGETSTTITVSTGGTYTAYYETRGVGGIIIPVDKFALLAPYIGLTSTVIVAAVVSVVYVKHVKHRKEKQ
jgi:hypothetical protein